MQSLSNAELMGLMVVSLTVPFALCLMYWLFVRPKPFAQFVLIVAVIGSYFPIGYLGQEGTSRMLEDFPLLIWLYWIGALIAIIGPGAFVIIRTIEEREPNSA